MVAGACGDGAGGRLRRLLRWFELLRFDATVNFDATSRNARRHRATLLAFDADLSRVAAIVRIRMDEASGAG